MYTRQLDLKKIVKQKSLLFFGPRQTGKSTLLKKCFPEALYIDLLKADIYRDLISRPELLRLEWPRKSPSVVIIDEVQKVPALLDEVHGLIEEFKDVRFILTGSSAKTLKRSGTNLLAGRAWPIHFHPLVIKELGNNVSDKEFLRLLNFGGLPAIYDSSFPERELKSYVGTYLSEEIRAFALVKNFERFSSFLESASISNCEILNFAKIGSDAQVPPRTVREYFLLLQDTLIGSVLNPYAKNVTRKMISASKFYYFDVGVANYLANRVVKGERNESYGKALEHWIYHELKTYIDYNLKDDELNYWHTQKHHEVDFLINSKLAVEVKATSRATTYDFIGLRELHEDLPKARRILVCNTPRYYKEKEGIEIFPVKEFLTELWLGNLF